MNELPIQVSKFVEDFLAYQQRQIDWKKANNKPFSDQEIRYFKWIEKGFGLVQSLIDAQNQQLDYIEELEREMFVLHQSQQYLLRKQAAQKGYQPNKLFASTEEIRSYSIANSQILDKW